MPLVESVAAAIIVEVLSTFQGDVRVRMRDRLAGKQRTKVMESAVAASLVAVEQDFPDFSTRTGGFDEGFLRIDAAPELAKVLIVGAEPDAEVLVSKFLSWADTSNTRATIVRHRDETIGPVRCLIDSWTRSITSSPLFADETRDNDASARTDLSRRIVGSLGATAATSSDRVDYLQRVVKDNRFLDNAGTGQTGTLGRLQLDQVFVALPTAEDHIADHRQRTAFDRQRIELEKAQERGALSATDLEAEMDRLHDVVAGGAEAVERTLGSITAEHQELVILGDPGAGKTTVARWLVTRHAEALLHDQDRVMVEEHASTGPVARFPIYVQAGSLVDLDDWRSSPLTDFLVANHQDRDFPNPQSLAALFDAELSAGHGLIVLDGLDEIPAAKDRIDVVRQIRHFADRWATKGNRFVVTSRIAGYDDVPVEGFSRFRIGELSPEGVTRFLHRYCVEIERLDRPNAAPEDWEAGAERRAEAVETSIRTVPGIARLAVNPLLLTILVLVDRNGVRIPNQRAAAYHAAVTALESGWRAVEGGDSPTRHLLNTMLMELGAWTHQHRPGGVLTTGDIVEAIGSEWAAQRQIEPLADGRWPADMENDIEKFVSSVARHNGLLVERAPERWSFIHQTFQEFYVARKLLDDPNPAAAIRRRLHDPRYEEPILLALGIASHVSAPRSDAAQIFDAALLGRGPLTDQNPELFQVAEYEDLLHRDRSFALKAAADDVEIFPLTLDELVGHYEQEMVRTFVLADRAQLMRELINLRGTRLADRLSENLQLLMTQEIRGDGIRQWAAEALGELGHDDKAVPVLEQFASSYQVDVGVRRLAAASLGRLGRTDVALTVLENLATDPLVDLQIRKASIQAIAELGPESDAPAVIRGIVTDPQTIDVTRQWAVEALGELRSADPKTITMLRNLNRSPDQDRVLRRLVATALHRLGEVDEAVVTLREMAEDSQPDGLSRLTAAQALGEVGDHEIASRVLLTLVVDGAQEPALRELAVEALGRQAMDPAMISTLETVAADPAEGQRLRRLVAMTLGRLGRTDLAAAVLRSLIDAPLSADAAQRAAIQALATLGCRDRTTLGVLRSLVADGESQVAVRRSAAQALGTLCDDHPDSLVALRAFADDGEIMAAERGVAERVLARLGHGSLDHVKELRVLADDGNGAESVRLWAANALSELGELVPPHR